MRPGRPDVIPLAVLIDLLVGELPSRYHPVAWMGAAIAAAEQRVPRQSAWTELAYGAVVALGGAGAVWAIARLLVTGAACLPYPFNRLLEAFLLKSTFSAKGLAVAAAEVEDALQSGDLPRARRLTAWHLVSRDTSALSATQVAAAAVESVAENTSDSIVAPLFFYAWGGLPAALAYRFLNTADAMLGYRDPRREWLGKVPARLDDALNWLPARLTALSVCLAALFTGDDATNAFRIWQRDADKTASPNAGHPMSAAAGALRVRLEKVGHYQLGDGQRLPVAQDIGRSVRLMYGTMAVASGVLALIVALRAVVRRP